MNVFGFYTTLLIGFLGGSAMVWILLCCKIAQAIRGNKDLQLSLLKRLEAASPKATPSVSQRNDI